MNDSLQNLFKFDSTKTMGYIRTYGLKLILAIFVAWIGFKIIKKLNRWLEKIMIKAKVSENIRPFLLNIMDVVMKMILIFIILNILGANLSGFVAILAAMGFAIGMSLQGSLGNFASGLLILSLKPYKVNDWIQLGDKFGRVMEIGIFNTKVLTPGNKVLIFPNSKITDDIVTNYSEKGMIRLEIDIHVPYEENFDKIKKIIREALNTVPKILDEPQPEIGIADFDSHSLQVIARPYVKPDDYWEVTFNVHKAIKEAFYKNNIQVPYSEGIEFGKFGA